MANLREAKASKVLRTLLSFVLFIMIVLFSLCVCSKTVFLNKSSIEDMFTDYEYVSSVKSSAIDYTSDIYSRNGLDCSNLDEIFNYELIRDSVKAYVANNIGSTAGFNESTYLEPIKSICSALEGDITKQIKAKGLKNNTESVSRISETVNDYLVNEIDISIPNAKTIINVGSIASVVILCVSLFFTLSIGLILFFIGSKRYRSIRAIGISFYTAGLFDIFLSLTVYIIFKIKHIDIFPIYLRELVMNYIHTCIGSVTVAGCFMLFAALIISVAVWKVRKGK